MTEPSKNACFQVLTLAAHNPKKIVVNDTYLRFTGSYPAAILLDECIFWTAWANQQERDAFYRTHAEWKSELHLTREQVDSARALLEGNGLLKSWVARVNGKTRVHYQIQWAELSDRLSLFVKDGSSLPRIKASSRSRNNEAPPESVPAPCQRPSVNLSGSLECVIPQTGKEDNDGMCNSTNQECGIPQTNIYTSLKQQPSSPPTPQGENGEIDRRERTRSNGGGEGDLSQLASSEPEPEAGTESLSLPAKPRAIALPPVKPLREGQEVPPPAAPKIQNFHHSAVENFDTRWHRPDVPWYDKATRKFHDALIGSYALSYPSIALLPNGQPNLPKIHRILANKLNSQDGIAELNLLWEQAQLGGNAPTQFAALADRLPKESGLAQGIALIANMPRRERRAAL